jgi:hypothetical protein
LPRAFPNGEARHIANKKITCECPNKPEGNDIGH